MLRTRSGFGGGERHCVLLRVARFIAAAAPSKLLMNQIRDDVDASWRAQRETPVPSQAASLV
jgi:hypothetical protein